jgi:diaminopimelate epimerase
MRIPFVKAHGARNDFLLTWAHEAPSEHALSQAAAAICGRHTGVGADGWLLVYPAQGPEPARIRLFNPDGGEVEISGNGTRCAAAFLLDSGWNTTGLVIRTGAGDKHLRVLESAGLRFLFEMNMGAPKVLALAERLELAGGIREAVLIDAGNPQCAFLVDSLDFDWRTLGAEVERHPRFPQRTNVSFVLVDDRHNIEVRFFERGAGATMSSGTGSTGAVAAAMAHGRVEAPVTVHTEAGPLAFRAEGETLFLQGPAEIVAGGEFYFDFG